MLFSAFLWLVVLCAVLPAILFCINLRRFRPPSPIREGQRFAVSVLIPARNEEANIGEAVQAVLRSRDVALEVLVMDDDSEDNTADIVQQIAARDRRVALLRGGDLPPGWNGKQYACWRLAHAATQPLFVFLDADVRIEPDLLARMAAFRLLTRTGLVSGFPRLITITWLEKLLLPLIHFVLLAFLPMRAMRRHTWPSAAAGCGQFLLLEREAYFLSGGHSAIRETMHDGLLLPRVLRKAAYRTDIADITQLASVRMYDGAGKVWQGLAKNATEGIATPGKIVPLTLLLFAGQVLPALLFGILLLARLLLFVLGGPLGLHVQIAEPRTADLLFALMITALIGSYLPRFLAASRFQQPMSSAALHPAGIFLLLCIQWYALVRKLMGKPVGWRQRNYSGSTGAELS